MNRDRSEVPLGGGRPRAERPEPALGRVDPMQPFIQPAREGDLVAVDRICAFLGSPLLKAIRALSGPENPDVEDTLQEVLLAVLDALPGFREDCTLLHFAIRIAIRRTTAARRRTRWIADVLEHLRLREEPLSTGPMSPRDATIGDRRRELMRTLLREIPDTQAETIVLRMALGHSVEEISGITSAPVNTVRSRLRLAKEALRNRIEADPRWAELWDEEP